VPWLGAVLVVDAAQGMEAQTLANCYLALEHDLEIVAALNKIDLPAADPDRYAAEIERVLGIPADSVLGGPENLGRGRRQVLSCLEGGRVNVAARGVGIAQRALELALVYSQQRKTFGKPIAAHQAIQFKLADMETRTAAARELLYRACAKIDRHEPDRGKYSAMAKLFASDTAMAVTVEAVQVLGGYGYVTEYPVERYLRDAKLTEIGEGTSQVQRLVIARRILGLRIA